MSWTAEESLKHHGILGQKHGVRNGPPYPLGSGDHSASERRAGWRKSLGGGDISKKARRYYKKTQNAKTREKYDKYEHKFEEQLVKDGKKYSADDLKKTREELVYQQMKAYADKMDENSTNKIREAENGIEAIDRALTGKKWVNAGYEDSSNPIKPGDVDKLVEKYKSDKIDSVKKTKEALKNMDKPSMDTIQDMLQDDPGFDYSVLKDDKKLISKYREVFEDMAYNYALEQLGTDKKIPFDYIKELDEYKSVNADDIRKGFNMESYKKAYEAEHIKKAHNEIKRKS